jgi:hypothetical protein
MCTIVHKRATLGCSWLSGKCYSLIQNAIHHRIRRFIFRTRHVRDIGTLKLRQKPARRFVQRKQIRMLDPIHTRELANDQLRIQTNGEFFNACVHRRGKPRDQAFPFGNIVSCRTDVHPNLFQNIPILVNQHGSACGRPWITPGTTVGEKCYFGRHGIL